MCVLSLKRPTPATAEIVMAQVSLTLDHPDTFTDGAQNSLSTGMKSVATKVIAEASRLSVDASNRDNYVYQDHVDEAFNLYLAQPNRWDKTKAWMRAGATFFAGVLTAAIPMAFTAEQAITQHLPWFVVSLLVGVNALACLTFIAYKGS